MAQPVLPGTYSGDPSSSPLDEVRFLVGDTNPNAFDLSDPEINYTFGLVYGLVNPVIPANGNYLPAAYCADSIAAKYKKAADKAVGDLHISYSQMAKQFAEIAVQLRRRATIAGVPTYFGGLSRAAKLAQYKDSDLLGTAITIDGQDNAPPIKEAGVTGNGSSTT